MTIPESRFQNKGQLARRGSKEKKNPETYKKTSCSGANIVVTLVYV
jgi:hypothetical protein